MSTYSKAVLSIIVFIRSIRASYRFGKGGQSLGFPMGKTEGLGILIYHCDDFVTMNTGLVDMPAAIVADTCLGGKIIVVNSLFMDSDKRFQDTILLHEEGHIKNGDLEYMSKLSSWKQRTFRNTERGISMEVAADMYSVENGGNKRDLLVFLGRIKSLYGDTKELRTRRRALLNM